MSSNNEVLEYMRPNNDDDPKLGIYALHTDVILPSYGTDDAACFDIRACLSHVSSAKSYSSYNRKEDAKVGKLRGEKYITIFANQRVLVPTGIIFDIPNGYSLRLHMRSGIAFKRGLILSNSEGIIDADYINETFVMMTNTTESTVTIKHNERICQGELVKIINTDIVRQLDVPSTNSNRTGGFGSTGTS